MVLSAVVLLPVIVFAVISSERVQNKVVGGVVEWLSEELGNHVSVGHVNVSWFNKLTVTDLIVTGLRGDTILNAPMLVGRMNFFALLTDDISIRKVELHRADIHFAYDTLREEINIKFIVEKLESKDTVSNNPRKKISIKTIELHDCNFWFTNPSKTFDRPFGMDYARLRVAHLNLNITGFRLGDVPEKGVYLHIQRLACEEQCGLKLQSLSADFFVNRNNLSFKNVNICTEMSEIAAKDVSFMFDSFPDFSNGGFISKVRMNIFINSPHLNFYELSHFVPLFRPYEGSFAIGGNISGTVDNLKGRGFDVRAGSVTDVRGNFDLKGLPDVRSTYVYAEINHLSTCLSDIEQIRLSRSKTGHIVLPETMKRLEEIKFKGNFTGFFDDFVTYGTFTTNLGNISTDLSIKPVMITAADTSFTFRGEMKTGQFHLGDLLGQPSIGRITMNGMVEGMASGPENISADIKGMIHSVYLRGYDYRNITMNGSVNNRMYDGQLSIDESNIKMDFSGKVDLTNPLIPSFDFRANVERARLYNLQLVAEDTSSFASFSIEAGFAGTNIDNINGQLNLKNSLIRRNNREIEINDLLVFTKAIRDTNRFILRSDILNAEVWGQYQFLKLPESFLSLLKNYAPSWTPVSVHPDDLSQNNFRFEAEFKNTEKLTSFFRDEFRIADGARLEGRYNPSQKDVHVLLNIPYMRIDTKRWIDFQVNASTEDSLFVLTASSQTFRWNDNMAFRELKISANAASDSVNMQMAWNDSVPNSGKLHSHVFFERSHRNIPLIRIFTDPGQIVTSGDLWNITHDGIVIDSSALTVNRLRAFMDNQEINVSGVISRNETDKLLIEVKNMELSVLNSSLQLKNLMLCGMANGTASLSNLYRIPVFVSNMHIADFSLNNGMFGDTHLSAEWNASSRSVHVETESVLNGTQTLFANGKYNISGGKLDFDIQVNKAPVSIFHPYLETVFPDMNGSVTSRMKLTGSVAEPRLDGEARLEQIAVTLDYTQAQYSLSGVVGISNNVLRFKDTQIFDNSHNQGKLNGTITAQHLRNLKFDISLNANNLEVLNTSEHHNGSFYGKAFAGGNIHISGTPADITVDINVRTAKNTQLNIPLTSGKEATQTSFISFVDHTPKERKAYTVAGRRRRMAVVAEGEEEQKMAVNLNVEVTPEAEVRLIFDAKVGDVMRAKGSGNISLNVTNTRFDIYGTYVVSEGDYLFTLQNVINKHFTLEKGGMITWNGSPTDALLNLKAKYTANPQLSDLMGGIRETGTGSSFVPVDCILHITNKLTDPNIRFELTMPTAKQEVRSFLAAATGTDEEMTRQMIWLIMMNRFYVDPSVTSKSAGSSGTGVENMAMATASEFMTNQLSHMINQLSDKVKVNLKYYPGMGMEGQNFGMDVSTNMWNLQFDYEVGGMRAAETSGNFLGDFTFDVKLNQSGKLRFKTFNRSNAQYFVQTPYTYGIGLLYREEFNYLKDLFLREEDLSVPPEEENDTKEEELTTENALTKG
ncbi:MAG: translocation/assembly module TamB [Bacteroidales bacterium]|nr:translocation/assembly module TamB [Bacteroidales bacterium]